MSIQVRYGGIHRTSASPRPPCDDAVAASIYPLFPSPSARIPPDTAMNHASDSSTCSSPSHSDKAESNEKNTPWVVAPLARRSVADDPERWWFFLASRRSVMSHKNRARPGGQRSKNSNIHPLALVSARPHTFVQRVHRAPRLVPVVDYDFWCAASKRMHPNAVCVTSTFS